MPHAANTARTCPLPLLPKPEGPLTAEDALSIERENLQAVLASSPVGMLLINEHAAIVAANAVLARLVDRAPGEILQQTVGNGLGCQHSLEHSRGCGHSRSCPHCALRRAVLAVVAEGTAVHDVEFKLPLCINWQHYEPWLRLSAEPVLVNHRPHVVVAIDNITRSKQLEEKLRHAASTDKLTALPNRDCFTRHLELALQRARQSDDYRFAVLFLDFDRFKFINDTFGHGVGDLLLQEIARRLRASIRAGDAFRQLPSPTAARLGGDEFVVLLDPISAPQDAQTVAARLLEVFAQPYRLGGHEVYSSASIGIVTSDISAVSADEVLRDADIAMYEAKLAGKARFAVFDVTMRQRLQARQHLEIDLRSALESGQLFLEYQPIVSLNTGQLESFEALLRWQHPRHGIIAPDEFIGIAEETGLILPIGQWILGQACRQFMHWRRTLPATAPRSLNVNLSRRQLLQSDLPAAIRRILADTGMPPQDLHLEVTESTLMTNAAATTGILRAIRDLGVHLDMDDFGTGYSSLACLHQFPIDRLKIDRSFIVNLNRGRDFAALVHAVAQLARNLNISVVAEGIETLDQAQVLQSLDLEFGQGFLFGQPLRADEVPGFQVPQIEL